MGVNSGTPLLRKTALRRRVFMKSFGLCAFLSFFFLSLLLVGLSVFVYLGLKRLAADEKANSGMGGDDAALQSIRHSEQSLEYTLPTLLVLAFVMAVAAAVIVGQIIHSIVVAKQLGIGAVLRRRADNHPPLSTGDLSSSLLRNSRALSMARTQEEAAEVTSQAPTPQRSTAGARTASVSV